PISRPGAIIQAALMSASRTALSTSSATRSISWCGGDWERGPAARSSIPASTRKAKSMALARKTLILFVLLAIAGLPLSCSENKASGDADMQRRKSHLAQIYEFYMTFSKANQRPPKQLADFKQYQGIDPVSLKALENGEYVAV